MEKKQEQIEVKISPEQVIQVMSGKRPVDMDYNVFKQVRKDIGKGIKDYKKGKMKHLSVIINDEINQDGDKVSVKHTRTYIKSA